MRSGYLSISKTTSNVQPDRITVRLTPKRENEPIVTIQVPLLTFCQALFGMAFCECSYETRQQASHKPQNAQE